MLNCFISFTSPSIRSSVRRAAVGVHFVAVHAAELDRLIVDVVTGDSVRVLLELHFPEADFRAFRLDERSAGVLEREHKRRGWDSPRTRAAARETGA